MEVPGLGDRIDDSFFVDSLLGEAFLVLTRVIYKERRGKRLVPLVAGLFLVGSLLLAAGVALAVHNTGLFELDGNAVSQNAAAPVGPTDDWDRVCHEKTGSAECGTTTNTTGATEIAWSADCL